MITKEHDSVLYVGMTNDLVCRISEHRAGEIPGFTADYRCRKLVYYEPCTDAREAIAREKQLKKWSRLKKVVLIATLNPRWIDLAPDILGK
jgi:putative endonuclease